MKILDAEFIDSRIMQIAPKIVSVLMYSPSNESRGSNDMPKKITLIGAKHEMKRTAIIVTILATRMLRAEVSLACLDVDDRILHLLLTFSLYTNVIVQTIITMKEVNGRSILFIGIVILSTISRSSVTIFPSKVLFFLGKYFIPRRFTTYTGASVLNRTMKVKTMTMVILFEVTICFT